MQTYNSYHYSLLLFFFVIFYLIIIDVSVAKYITIATKNSKIQIEKIIWKIKNNPNNPIVKYLIYRRSLRMAKDMLTEINKDKKIK